MTKPLAQSKSQLSMLRLPKNPIRVSTRKRPAEIKLMIFGGHRGRVMAMLISAMAKATRAPHAIPLFGDSTSQDVEGDERESRNATDPDAAHYLRPRCWDN